MAIILLPQKPAQIFAQIYIIHFLRIGNYRYQTKNVRNKKKRLEPYKINKKKKREIRRKKNGSVLFRAKFKMTTSKIEFHRIRDYRERHATILSFVYIYIFFFFSSRAFFSLFLSSNMRHLHV